MNWINPLKLSSKMIINYITLEVDIIYVSIIYLSKLGFNKELKFGET